MAVDMQKMRKIMVGLALGDALGATSEFQTSSAVGLLLEKYRAAGWPFIPVGGGVYNWRAGQGTGDSEMALLLAASLAEKGTLDVTDVCAKFASWYEATPRDVGSTIGTVLSALRKGESWDKPARDLFVRNPANSPSGGLMRNGVVAAAAANKQQAFLWSTLQCITTHYHPLCVLTCCVQTWLLWEIFEKRWPMAASWIDEFCSDVMAWLNGCDDDRISGWRRDVAARGVLPTALEELRRAELDATIFNPYADESQSLFSSLYALQIAVWALWWSRCEGEITFKSPYSAELFHRRGVAVLGWVALIGGEANTYGAAAGPLVAAATDAAFNPATVAKLEIVRQFDKLHAK